MTTQPEACDLLIEAGEVVEEVDPPIVTSAPAPTGG